MTLPAALILAPKPSRSHAVLEHQLDDGSPAPHTTEKPLGLLLNLPES